jgi:hypothetical protein
MKAGVCVISPPAGGCSLTGDAQQIEQLTSTLAIDEDAGWAVTWRHIGAMEPHEKKQPPMNTGVVRWAILGSNQ